MSEEKSIAAELKEVLDAAVAEKANKTDLEGFAKSEDLEGVVKSEQLDEVKAAHAVELEAVKTEIREEMEAKFASAPGMVAKAVEEKQEMFKPFTKTSGETVSRFEMDLTKKSMFLKSPGTGEVGTIDGSTDAQEGLFYTLEQFNPFRAVAQIMQVSSGQFKLPSISGISFSSDGSGGVLPLSRADSTSAIGTKNVLIENWSSYSDFSRPTLEDLEGIRSSISSLIVQAYSTAQAGDAQLVLKTSAGTADGIGQDTHSHGTDPLSNATIVSELASMIENQSVAYLNGAQFHMHPRVYSLLSQSTSGTGTGLEFDPTTGVTRFFGYPMTINGYLDDGSAATNVSAYFGQFNRSLVLAERRSLSIDEYDQVSPGYNTYYSEGRFKHAIWDPSGMRALRTLV